jgi:hypothetical protein
LTLKTQILKALLSANRFPTIEQLNCQAKETNRLSFAHKLCVFVKVYATKIRSDPNRAIWLQPTNGASINTANIAKQSSKIHA